MISVSPLRRLLSALTLTAATALALTPAATFAQSKTTNSFALKSGDRVVFYGDSITDQRMYTLLTEEYIVTRFPTMDIRFVHSGWGGDRVTGGGGGPINTRLDRDVTPYKPTVVTIMLGMNDGAYRAYDEGIFKTYTDGYKYLADKIKKDNSGVRLTFIQPSPYDDVTRPANFEGGYNAVLTRYGAFLTGLASAEGASIADLNTPVVAMLTKANTVDNALAQKILPDRVHPGWGGHLIMAESLLKSWNAPSLVSSVTVDAKLGKATTENAEVKAIKTANDGTVTWTTTEGALPFPIPFLSAPSDTKDDSIKAFRLALASSDFVDAMDREMLTVTSLTAATYTLKIDDQEIGTFTKEQLATGVNLATLQTPMWQQADAVASLTQARATVHNWRWREFQVPRTDSKAVQPLMPTLLKDIDTAGDSLTKAQRDAARPRPHTFTLVPKG